VLPLSQDELSIYSKEKQFTTDSPHPNGTIFRDQKTKKLFLISNDAKLPVPNETILKTYSKQNPVLADLETANLETSCLQEKKFLSSKNFACELSLQSLTSLVGNDYQISVEFPTSASLANISATFSTPLSWNSLRNSLSKIKTALGNR
jgi:hypothetical protein